MYALIIIAIAMYVGGGMGLILYDLYKYPLCPKCGENVSTKRISWHIGHCLFHGQFKIRKEIKNVNL